MIAIDPGPQKSAVVKLYQGKIQHAEIMSNELVIIFLQNHAWEPLAIEMIKSYGMPVGAETFETCLWIGRFIQCHSAQHRLLGRKEVVSWICSSAKAKDSNVRQALIDRYGEPGTKKNPGHLYGISKDLWSALAVALTALETRGTWASR